MSTGNYLLDSLTRPDFERLSANLKPVTIQRGDSLASAGRRSLYAYFPVDSVISAIGVTDEGQTVEGGVIGREGLLGLTSLLGDGLCPHHAMVRIGGNALKITIPMLKSTFDWSGTFREAVLRYAQYYMTQVTQTAICNRTHSLEARLARWLLTARDSVGSTELDLTHEVLAQMLGVHRPGVTMTVGGLRDMGIIRCARGRIILLQPTRLLQMSCGCYRTVRHERDRLLGIVSTAQQPASATPSLLTTLAR